MTNRENLAERLDALETEATSSFDPGVTIVLDADYVDREPEADNVVLASDYSLATDADRGRQ